MKFIIFSDLDGTFLNNDTYSFGSLRSYISKCKFKFELIFVSSKTYEEILIIQDKLKINFPFIVENGACIFFPLDYFRHNKMDFKFTKYKNHLVFKLTKLNPSQLAKQLHFLKEKYDFSFYMDLTEKKISKITKLRGIDVKLSKIRKFTNPIFWEDSPERKKDFRSEIKSINANFDILEGGRFIHISDKYDKGLALKKFLKIKNVMDESYTTISLGDSENDIPMLELTDFACIIKSKTNINFLKKKKNVYRSNSDAPEGWKESLEYIFNKEIKNY